MVSKMSTWQLLCTHGVACRCYWNRLQHILIVCSFKYGSFDCSRFVNCEAQLSRHIEIRTISCLAASRSAVLTQFFARKVVWQLWKLSTETPLLSGNTALSDGTREKEIVDMFFLVRVMSIFGRVAKATDYPKLIARLGTHKPQWPVISLRDYWWIVHWEAYRIHWLK